MPPKCSYIGRFPSLDFPFLCWICAWIHPIWFMMMLERDGAKDGLIIIIIMPSGKYVYTHITPIWVRGSLSAGSREEGQIAEAATAGGAEWSDLLMITPWKNTHFALIKLCLQLQLQSPILTSSSSLVSLLKHWNPHCHCHTATSVVASTDFIYKTRHLTFFTIITDCELQLKVVQCT